MAKKVKTYESLEGELTDEIHIDVNLIPDHVREALAAATLEFIRGILRQPGGRELLDARIAADKAASTKPLTGKQNERS